MINKYEAFMDKSIIDIDHLHQSFKENLIMCACVKGSLREHRESSRRRYKS